MFVGMFRAQDRCVAYVSDRDKGLSHRRAVPTCHAEPIYQHGAVHHARSWSAGLPKVPVKMRCPSRWPWLRTLVIEDNAGYRTSITFRVAVEERPMCCIT